MLQPRLHLTHRYDEIKRLIKRPKVKIESAFIKEVHFSSGDMRKAAVVSLDFCVVLRKAIKVFSIDPHHIAHHDAALGNTLNYSDRNVLAKLLGVDIV